MKQRQERASTNAHRYSTRQGKRAVRCSQEGCLQQHASSQRKCADSSMCDGREGTSIIYWDSVNRRQGWDGRVYHHPALLSQYSNRQLRHSNTERANNCSAANRCGCWLDESPAGARDCMQRSTEELELVSLLQVHLFTTFPAFVSHCAVYTCTAYHVPAQYQQSVHKVVQHLNCVPATDLQACKL